MIVVGLDLSLTGSGIAVVEDDTLLAVYCVGSQKKYGHMQERHRLIRRKVVKVVRKYKPDHVVIEDYAHHQRNQSTMGELGGVVKMALWEKCGLDPTTQIHLAVGSSVKLFATGSGRASKDDMVEAAQPYMDAAGIEAPLAFNDNAADALWIALYGLNKYS